jgi:hypothetical protein
MGRCSCRSAPVRIIRAPEELKELGDDFRLAFYAEHLCAEIARVERVAGWRDSIVSVELSRDERGVEVHAVHVDSR